ncbi:NIPSNAP family protein [Gymnodinialimonas sp. 2305UL16-5]|uniref:NIPSNAP family protein n=1 Tax=Gymnodinialimonas mytili TaxID=3126503 RepID=UPI00309FEEA7
MINQLRIYELFPETQPEFLDRFRDHAARIMRSHDFKILAMWTTTHDEKPAFAYLLSWRSETAMAEGWSRFMADEEWQSIKAQRDPGAGPIVGNILDLQLDPVTFSKAL